MCASLRRTRRLHSAAASWLRSLMPSNRPSSSKPTAATMRPSSRASRTRSVRYSSPVAADGSSVADPPAQPRGVERVQPGVDLVALELLGRGVLGLDDPLDGPELAAHDAPERRPGRRRRRWPARSRRRRRGAPRARPRGRSRSPAARRRTARGPRSPPSGTRGQRGPDGVAGPARLVLEGERRPARRRPRDRGDRRRVDDDRRRARGAVGRGRPGVEDVGEHRPAAHRVQDLGERGPHARPEPGRQHDERPALVVGPDRGWWAVIRRVAAWYGRLVRGVNRPAACRRWPRSPP